MKTGKSLLFSNFICQAWEAPSFYPQILEWNYVYWKLNGGKDWGVFNVSFYILESLRDY